MWLCLVFLVLLYKLEFDGNILTLRPLNVNWSSSFTRSRSLGTDGLSMNLSLHIWTITSTIYLHQVTLSSCQGHDFATVPHLIATLTIFFRRLPQQAITCWFTMGSRTKSSFDKLGILSQPGGGGSDRIPTFL